MEQKDGKTVVKNNYIRDEEVQAKYIAELLDIFREENLAGAFVFTFVNPSYAHNKDPLHDLDMAGYGIVKIIGDTGEESYKGLPWTPKKAFYRLGEYYRNMN